MKLNNKGFAISSILYMALILFLVLIMALLSMMGGRKNILDKIRLEAYNIINNIVDTSEKSSDLNIALPTLSENMIPIVYNPAGYAVKADVSLDSNGIPHNWYNYTQRKWANAVVVKESGTNTRDYYNSANAGTTINQEDILGYFVWVPRYKYSVNSSNKNINVIFEEKGTTKSSGNAVDSSYLTHPAFTFNENELDGIWVSKFLSSVDTTEDPSVAMDSGDSNIKILPGKDSLLTLSAQEMFWITRKMEMSNNIYGFLQTSTIFPTDNGVIESDSNTLDTHVLKNSEWGAISILSLSRYGINGTIKNYDSNNTSYTGGGLNMNYLVNGSQTTTGNIYGIYDMVSTTGELVMGYKSDDGLSYGTDTYVNDIFYDKYASDVTIGIKGDLTNNDLLTDAPVANFPNVSEYFLRGQSSLLSYNSTAGSANSNIGFRISLVIWE